MQSYFHSSICAMPFVLTSYLIPFVSYYWLLLQGNLGPMETNGMDHRPSTTQK